MCANRAVILDLPTIVPGGIHTLCRFTRIATHRLEPIGVPYEHSKIRHRVVAIEYLNWFVNKVSSWLSDRVGRKEWLEVPSGYVQAGSNT